MLYGGDDADTLIGDGHSDLLYGGTGNDLLFGGTGSDTFYGGDGNDKTYGGTNSDMLYGGNGNDMLFGDKAGDGIYGGAGNDYLDGGTSKDDLYGGLGADKFAFMLDGQADEIHDFMASQGDRIVLDHRLWCGSLTIAQVISQFATVDDGTVEFEFSTGDRLLIDNFHDLAGLAGRIDII